MPERKNQRTKRTPAKDESSLPSPASLPSLPSTEGFIPAHGGYENLLSFQKARIVFDGTVRFCDRFVDKYSRTHDQMVQGARSGKQNILEGSQASGTSKETEIKLTSVARASLEELLEDYRDFLRLRGLDEWPLEHRYTRRLRELNRQPDANYETFKKGIEHPDPAIAANVMIGLIKVTNYLLDQQLRRLEQDFLKEGGLRERMTRARLAARDQQQRGGPHAP
jgi:four helix bundle suffix protein